jgi:hypothetical protein
MAYTRKNKVLRIKIGYLDSRLIHADTDMFIRRVFSSLKLMSRMLRGLKRRLW